MLEAHNNVVSIESFRAARARSTSTIIPNQAGARRHPSPRSVEHRERMLRFLRAVAVEGRPGTPPQGEQGRLLL